MEKSFQQATKLLWIAITLLILAGITACIMYCDATIKVNGHWETDKDSVKRFYTAPAVSGGAVMYHRGQIILPDYAIGDTLIVVDDYALNRVLESNDFATDGEIDSVFNIYCTPVHNYVER